jgi:hypothetical protein
VQRRGTIVIAMVLKIGAKAPNETSHETKRKMMQTCKRSVRRHSYSKLANFCSNMFSETLVDAGDMAVCVDGNASAAVTKCPLFFRQTVLQILTESCLIECYILKVASGKPLHLMLGCVNLMVPLNPLGAIILCKHAGPHLLLSPWPLGWSRWPFRSVFPVLGKERQCSFTLHKKRLTKLLLDLQ